MLPTPNMLSAPIALVSTFLTSWGRFLLRFIAVCGALPFLCSAQAYRLAKKTLLCTFSTHFPLPSANFPTLFHQLQITYIALQSQCIAEGSLVDRVMDFEVIADQLSDAIIKTDNLVEASRMAKMLYGVGKRYRQLRQALREYHQAVDLRYCQVMYHGDGALLSLRSSIGSPEAVVYIDGMESPETRRILDRTFIRMLEFHQTSVISLSTCRSNCWTLFHALNKDLAALQCFIAEKNPRLHRRYGVDVLVNLWESLGAYTESADIADRCMEELSTIVAERERLSEHLLAGKSILDKATSSIEDLWKEQLGSGRGIPYDEQLEGIIGGVRYMREARDKATASTNAAPVYAQVPTPPAIVDNQVRFERRDMIDHSLERPLPAVGSPLRRHYSVM